jgi:peptide/nickel transport system permease protein
VKLDRVREALIGNIPITICVTFIVAVTALAIAVSVLPLPDPTAQSVLFRLKPPSPDHLLGTDRLGRDILSRVLWGARVSLLVGVGVVAVSASIGLLLGVFGGYFEGWPSEVVLRFTDILLAFPPLILAMVTVTILGNNLFTVVLAISVGTIPRFARLTRGTILAIRERGYVEAARCVGASAPRVIWHHVLLNAVDPVIVLCTLLIPTAILTEALLSFLGLGVTEPTPTWGNMINSGQIVLREAPWLTFFPALAIVLTVLAFNLVGDAIRDALDPAVRDPGAPTPSAAGPLPEGEALNSPYADRQRKRATHSSWAGNTDGRVPAAFLAPGAALGRAAASGRRPDPHPNPGRGSGRVSRH